MTPRIGLVAGEPSGDLLASRIMQGLRQGEEPAHCAGIGGPAMAAQGLETWHPMHALTVFGYVDAFKRLPGLLATYFDVKRRWLSRPPDVFVGIDAPDFNLRLERVLKEAGIPTVHFVGPSIWAWRYERIHKIRAAVSHMLVLFPFEEALYRKEGVPVTYVGHPLASVIPMEPDRQAVRRYLGVPADARVLALMPGSRASEIRLLAPRFLQAVRLLQAGDPELHVLVPMVNAQRRAEFEAALRQYPISNCRILGGPASDETPAEGNDPADAAYGDRPAAWNAMEAADAVLVASGTATLEAALFKRPMVISYVLSPMMRRLMAWKSGQSRPYVPWVGLPNVLLDDFAVPELLQDDATPQALAEATRAALYDAGLADRLQQRFMGLHAELKRDTAGIAAKVILEQAGAS
jgi:lipid-A-disaccharide synthase